MSYKIIIYGATGMVGQGALLECVNDMSISDILCVGRRDFFHENAKVKNLVLPDMFDYSDLGDSLEGYDACFFCLGTTSLGKSEKEYAKITYDLTMDAAEHLQSLNPNMTFIYVSAAGADSSEKGRVMWARVRGRLENKLFKKGFKKAYSLRPSYIQPLDGIKSRTALYQALYSVVGFAFPLIKKIAPDGVTSTRCMGRAMINLLKKQPDIEILDPVHINCVANKST